MTSILSYRRDIDGLRGLAVVSVVLFHAGISIFEGGFIGVDIFFVISGYLITSIIKEEMSRGWFSIVSFYERRIRRIFPALFSVVFLSSIAAYYIFMPVPFRDFGQSLVACTLFVSNFLFRLESGYFDSEAATKPLLHTWSLAVEEQFYIIFPILLLGIIRWFVGREQSILFLLTALSLTFSIWYVEVSPKSTFYLLHGRAWELLLGASLVYASFPILSHRLTREIVGVIGIGLIAWGIVSFTTHTTFPGFNALFPCIGAMLIIASGRYGNSMVGEMLSSQLLVSLGLMSYSLYLWHWPLLVFYNEFWIHVSPVETALVVGVAMVVSFFSWQIIERPFRKPRGVLPRSGIFLGAGLLMVCAMSLGLWGHFSNGWPQRLPPRVQELFREVKDGNPRQQDCLGTSFRFVPVEDACVYGANVPPSFVVWGDSHADSLMAMVGEKLRQQGQSAKFFGAMGCPPIMGLKSIREKNDKCYQFNKHVLEFIEKAPGIQSVLMIARYSVYVHEWSGPYRPTEDNKVHRFIANALEFMPNDSHRNTFFEEPFLLTIDRLVHAGKKVVLVYPLPEPDFHIPNAIGQLILRGENPEVFTIPYGNYQKRNQFIFELFAKFKNNDAVVHVFPHERLCDDQECIVFGHKHPLYLDDNHLSSFGVKYVGPAFDDIFRQEE